MPRPTDPRNPAAGPVYRLAARLAFVIMALQRWRWDVRGSEHLPATGGAVITSNHTSFWDYFAVGRVPYLGAGRPIRILAKASLFRVPVVGWVLRRAGHIPVHRGAGAAALRDAVAALRAGELVLVLPEQTISRSFELLDFKRGAARMAAQAGVPVIPSVSWGTHRFHTAGRWPRWCWRLPVSIRFGAPLHPSEDDDLDEVMAQLRHRTRLLLDDAQRSYPDGTPAGAWWVPSRLGGSAPTDEEGRAHHRGLSERWKQQRARDPRDG